MQDADLLDPNPDIHALFCHYNHLYFNDALGACTVDWSSKRMTLCAGICQYMKMGGCAIRLSEPLLKFRSTTDFKNTLLHEMIHAYLWLTDGNKDHNDHGPCFQKVMKDINISALPDHQRPASGYDITIYHNFTDEVNNYRTHHWKCQNCGDLIKRAMNRQPSASDCMIRAVSNELCNDTRCHWHQHRRKCGGEYTKIAEPAGYQDKRRNTKNNGKRDLDGKVKDETNIKKLNKTSSVSVHTKEENAKGASSHKTCNLESFYPKLEKKENVNLDEHLVIDEKDSDEDNEEILIIKRRKCNPEVRIKECSSLTQRVEAERKTKTNHEGTEKAGSSSTSILEFEQKLHKKEGRRRQKSDHVDGGSVAFSDVNVIIKWKGWYAHEREDDEEGVEPLINKRQERRRKEKMLNHIEMQKMGNLQVSVEAARCEKLCDNADASMFEADRKDTTVRHSQGNLIEADVPRLDTSKTDMLGCSSYLISPSTNLECSCFCNLGSSQASLPCHDSNRTRACLIEGSYFKHTNSAKMGFESTFQRNISTSGMEVDACCDSVRARKSSISGFIGNVREKFGPSNVVDKKETLDGLDLDLKGRRCANLIQLDDTHVEAASPKMKSLEHETDLSIKHSSSTFSGAIKGKTTALEKMSSSLEISSSESEENCFKNSNLGDEHGKKRVRRLLCSNGQAKGEEKGSWKRQVIKAGNVGNSAACPVCNKVLEGDIGEGDFNQRFNAHLDRCIASCS